jgi:hypothetical protein
MFDSSNTPVAVRAEDQPLVEAINDARRRYGFSDAAAEHWLNAFTNPEPTLKTWIFELCDPSPRADPFMTNDDLAAFTRAVLTGGQDCSARWADLSRTVRRLARRIKHFAQDKRRVWMGAGPPRNVDQALVLYVIRRIEEATGIEFRFSQRRRPAEAAFDEDESSPPLNSSRGPMLRLAEAALLRLFHIDDRTAGYLGLVSPARHYRREEIARTAKLARRASRTSPASPAKWPSARILAFPSDVRVELAGKARQENTDQGSASPSSWGIASWWGIAREVLEAAVAGGRQTRLKYGSGLDVLQANLKSGAQPDLIELSKRRSPRVDVRQE